MSRTGIPSVTHTTSRIPASAASSIASRANRAGTKTTATSARVAATAAATASYTGAPSTVWPPLPGETPATRLVPAARMRAAGTSLVAGVSPGKGGQTVAGAPAYDAVAAAVAATRADVAVLFVPARFARDAMLEAADAGIRLVVCVTEGIPVRDMAEERAATALQRRHH